MNGAQIARPNAEQAEALIKRYALQALTGGSSNFSGFRDLFR